MASYCLPVSTLSKWKLSSVTCIQIFTDKVSTVNSLQKLHEYFYLGAACEMTMTVFVGFKKKFLFTCVRAGSSLLHRLFSGCGD